MKIIMLLGALLVQTMLLGLAYWQWSRYQQATAAAQQPVVTASLSGTLLHAATAVLDAQPNPSFPQQRGWRILTPLQLPSTQLLIIDRGWSPAMLKPNGEPDFSTFRNGATSATITVSGQLLPLPQRRAPQWLRGPNYSTHPRLLTFLSPAHIISSTVSTTYLAATTATAGIAVAQPPRAPFPPERHLAYALQWLTLGAIFPALCMLARRRNKRRP